MNGKKKGWDFIDKDCVDTTEGNVTSIFPHDFFSQTSYATCPPGR